MRIAQLCPLFVPVPPEGAGGTERVVADLTHALIARGHEVEVFAASGSSVPGLRDMGAPISTLTGAPPGLPGAREAVMLDRVAAEAERFDVIHCHTEFAHAAVLREHAQRTLTTVHWRMDEADRRAFFTGFPDLPVAAISAAQAADYAGRNLRGVVHHGLPEDRYAMGAGRGGYAAFVGRMTDQKRPDAAIRIARSAGLNCRLAGGVDVGNPRYFDGEVAPLLGDDAVHVGTVDDTGKQALLGEAVALLMPIDWPEPFGLVMIEAMACGTPVVAMRRGAAPEIVEDGVSGFLVETEEEAAAALGRAASLDRSAVRAAFEARFTADRMATGYEAIYEGLAGAGS